MSSTLSGKTASLPRRLGPRAAGMSLTPAEFDALPTVAFDPRFRYELIRGTLVVTPPPLAAERGPNDDLGFLLLTYREAHPNGSALDATLPEHTVFAANRRRYDRAIWAGLGRMPDEAKDRTAIIVEFVSASRRHFRRDYEERREEYLAAGVLEYWIIDRFRRIMIVYKTTPAGIAEAIVREGETYLTDLLPGFILPLARLLAKADDWPRKGRRTPRAGGTDG